MKTKFMLLSVSLRKFNIYKVCKSKYVSLISSDTDSLSGATKHDTHDHKKSINLLPTPSTRTNFVSKSIEGMYVIIAHT